MSVIKPNAMRAARAVAEYYIGDGTWADMILDAYFNPDKALEELAMEKGED